MALIRRSSLLDSSDFSHHTYTCVVGLMTSSGTEARAGNDATNSTAWATSSGCSMLWRCTGEYLLLATDS
ncbi:hypothetical protein BH10PLA2_BH10PLA2_02220 [soil metagenome]